MRLNAAYGPAATLELTRRSAAGGALARVTMPFIPVGDTPADAGEWEGA
jgi:hypothetical protein